MKKLRAARILVVVPTATFTQRQRLEGLLEYAHRHANPPWQFHLDLSDLNPQSLHRLRAWGCDGVVAFVMNARDRRRYTQTGLPTLLLDPTSRARQTRTRIDARVVSFINDHRAEGDAAAAYFLARGYANFAYVGTATPMPWSADRRDGFAARLARAGRACIVYPPLPPRERDDFALEARRLVRWLRALPKPVALFAVHDRRAQQIIATAVSAGLRVPEDIAVLGVDNDTLLCETTVPAISSIDVCSHAEGYQCGAVLDDLLHGRPCPAIIRNVHATVVTRRSTDAAVGATPALAAALGHIQSHLGERLRVKDLARLCGCTPKTLQLLARRTLGRSIGDEIRHRRLARAARLLATTRRTVEDIAHASGFCGASHLGVFFKAAFGRAPADYRRAQTRR